MRSLLSFWILSAAACTTSVGADPTGEASSPDGGGDVEGVGDACAGGIAFPVYLSRFGGTYVPGADDSTMNSSSILQDTSELPAYPYGPASWTSLMGCVADKLAPFDVHLTDEDPGDEEHLEIVVTTTTSTIGVSFDATSGGPAACEFNRKAVAYVFAQAVDNGDTPTGALCGSAARVIGLMANLDSVAECSDLMTHSTDEGCGQEFSDLDVACGDVGGARECMCGGATQNSHQQMLQVFGAAPCGGG